MNTMATATVTRMDALEISAFLETQSAGVLALADDDDGYAVPVSFAFDDDTPQVYFRLGYGPDSQKRRFVEASDDVSFVVHDDTDEGWKSVIARGELEAVSRSSADSAVVESVRDLDIPFYQVHDRPAEEMSFHLVRLNPTELSGIVEG